MKLNLFLALILMATSSHAVYEDFETNNSTLATAQDVGGFSENLDIHIFGGRGEVPEFFGFADDNEIDYYSFDVEAGTSVSIEVITAFGPEETGESDPVLALYDFLGVQLAGNDDGHEFGYDSALTYTFDADGTFIIAISGFNGFDNDEVFDPEFISADGDTDFLYTAHISSVPVPAAVWLFSSALVGLVGLGRRKNI